MYYQLQKTVRYYTPTYQGETLRITGDENPENEEMPSTIKPELPATTMYFSGTNPGAPVLAVESFEILCGEEVDEDGCFTDCESCESSEPTMAEIRKFFWTNVPVSEAE